MINNYINILERHFNKDNLIHFGDELSTIMAEYIEAIEIDLKKVGKELYSSSVPDDFKNDLMLEDQGYRILYPLLKIEPPAIPLHIGKTTMHIKNNQQNNLDTLLLIYTGDITSEILNPSDIQISAYEQAIVALSEDGALSAIYDEATRNPCVCTWFPEEMTGDGRLPYPKNLTDLYVALEQKLDQKGLSPSPEIYYMLPDIVMLAVQTYEESVPLKGKIIHPTSKIIN